MSVSDKPKCSAMITPVARKGERNLSSRQCGRCAITHGFCNLHHPSTLAKKQEKLRSADEFRKEVELAGEERRTQRLWNLRNVSSDALTIDSAIVLLVKSGYRVELLIKPLELSDPAPSQK